MKSKRKALVMMLAALVLLCAVPGVAWGQASTLARTFNGTSDNLQSAATIDLTATNKLSISFWLYWDSFADDDDVALELSANYNLNAGSFIVLPGDSSNSAFFVALRGDGGNNSGYFTRPSAAAWHHYLIVFDMSLATNELVAVYVDGSAQSLTRPGNVDNTANFGNYTLNVMSRNAASLFGDGRISDITIWKPVLTSGNATTLAACGDPETIDAANITNRWKIVQASPETPSVGAVNLTVTGTSNSNASCTAAASAARRRVLN